MSSPPPLSRVDRLRLYEEPVDPPPVSSATSESDDNSSPAPDPQQRSAWLWLTGGEEDARDLIEAGASAKPRAEWGLRGWVNGATGGLAGLAPGPEESAHAERRARIREASWWRALRILVANKTGGAGKTVSTLALGGTLAEIRGGAVAAMEVSDAAGALGKRCEGRSDGIAALAALESSRVTPAVVAQCMRVQTSTLDVAGSSRPRPELTEPGVQAAVRALESHYEIVVLDSGNNPYSGAWVAARDLADVLVIPTLLTTVSVIDALDVLDEVATSGAHGRRLAERAVIVVNSRSSARPDQLVSERCRDQLLRVQAAHPGIALLDVPFDPHLAREGEVTLSALSRESRVAWTRVADAAISPPLG